VHKLVEAKRKSRLAGLVRVKGFLKVVHKLVEAKRKSRLAGLVGVKGF
jgi:hypothetical protein